MLTEKELLNMPEDAYMNEEQLAFFKELLLQQKQELSEAIDDAKKSLAESERNTDLNDVATSQEMQQLYLRTVDRQSKLLRKVNESLKHIENGEYGYCELTGEPIGVQRLLARPTATLSVQAKEIQEHQERTQGIIKA
ncbi:MULTISPECIES: RNA polymerase-binding protein DksA [Cysteiniphilum]|uniref:RNA polymerase-binding transcription factor DksA n=1 Tax=Cysteiniphilum litorale TaxID=2056700 RepID=A0A8J3E807_9GAMM|nr:MULTISPECIES: RNA polymerase-binding protein DksA [Cysteiniphilum]MDA0909975.1 RNA polymerase-binding protein DksA [Pseudomonadota bacterium]GGF89729.1 RNA polymerase-binding transcription factor DksA [Cysteiniphilum litorale]